jgi:hypothetical protein
MEQLIYEVNGIKYLLFSAVLKTKAQANDLTAKVERHNGIIQSYDIEESFWNGTSVKVKMLIPGKLAYLFSSSKAEL